MRLSLPSFRLLSRTPSVPREPPPSPDLRRLNARRLSEDARVLTLLGSACTLGATVGALGTRASGRGRTRAFFQAATGTHLFVLGTVLVGAGAVWAQELPRLGLRTTVRRGRVLQRLLGVGLGLDGVSIALGAALLAWRRGNSAWREGAGASFLLHGLALLVFDSGVFRRNALYQHRVEELSRTSSGQAVVTRRVFPERPSALALGNLERTALI
jgi:hypothetical protein